jgi:hypothetical protein
MNIWFAVLFAVFLILLFLLAAGVTIFSPEVGILLISSLAFGLFAFRLLSAYILVMATADLVKEGKAPSDWTKLAEKSGKSEEEIKNIPLSAVLALVMAALEPYRYTFYFAFVIILLVSLVAYALPAYADMKLYTEALFWGAALTTFIVWAFETFAQAAVEEVAEIEQQQGGTQNS